MNTINITALAHHRLKHFTALLRNSTTDEMYLYRLKQIRCAKNQINQINNNQNLEFYEYKSRKLPSDSTTIDANTKRIICDL